MSRSNNLIDNTENCGSRVCVHACVSACACVCVLLQSLNDQIDPEGFPTW